MSEVSGVFDVDLVFADGASSREVRNLKVRSNQHIWDAAFAAGIKLPAMCHQGRCLTCAARLLKVGEVDQSDSVSYYSEDREAGFLLPCTARPRSSLRILTHQAEQMRAFRRSKGLPSPYS